MTVTRAPKTIVVYDLTGLSDFTIPFDYLARKFIAVTLIGADRKVLTLNTDYRFTTKTQITLNVPSPAGYEQIEIRRFTSANERLVNFHDGSILRAYDLNLSQIQTLHVAEEARDLAGDSLSINDEGFLDARGRKIINLGDATDPNDAVNLSLLTLYDDSTKNNADRAEASKERAVEAETRSIEAATRSVTAEVRAIASAGVANQAAVDSRKSRDEAKASEDHIKPLIPIAEQAAVDAADSAEQAEQAVRDVKDLGAVPVGTILMFAHKAIPAGYIDLCVPSPVFNVTEYPDLAKLYPDGRLPSYLNRYPKGFPVNTVSTLGDWMIPEHTHETNIQHGHSATQAAHSHTRGSMNIEGYVTLISGYGGSPISKQYNGSFSYGGDSRWFRSFTTKYTRL